MSKSIDEKANNYVISKNYCPDYGNGQILKDAFRVGFSICQKEYEAKLLWIPVEEELPLTYNCQILVRKSNENLCDLRFFHHANQFKLICDVHKYTHWLPVFL